MLCAVSALRASAQTATVGPYFLCIEQHMNMHMKITRGSGITYAIMP